MRAASYSDLARLEQRVAKLEAGRPGWSDVAEATGEGLEGEHHGETPDVCEDRYACENAKRCDGVVCSEGEVDGPQFFGMDPDMPSRIRKALGLSITHEEGLGGLVERLLAEHKREREAEATVRRERELGQLRARLAETVESLTALAQPLELWADVDRCERCGDVLDGETCGRCERREP